MSNIIKPFQGLRPKPAYLQQVIAPPYDVVTREQAQQLAADNPFSFLHLSKAEIDLPMTVKADDERVYQAAAQQLQRFITDGILVSDEQPGYYVYQIQQSVHIQTGLVAAVSVAAYQQQRIKKHEHTRPAKVADRVKLLTAQQTQISPVLLTHKYDTVLADIYKTVCQAPCQAEVSYHDDEHHRLWIVDDAAMIASLSEGYENLNTLYIADGHHRSEAAYQYATAMHPEAIADQAMLAVIFPHNELTILSYNRIIKDLNGLTPAQLLAALADKFAVINCDTDTHLDDRNSFKMYLDGSWYMLTLKQPINSHSDVISGLPVTLLHQLIIEPIFNIYDPRKDERIDFVGGLNAIAELEHLVQQGNAAVAFVLYPTSIEQLMAVADAKQVMPPKSTWFEPKLLDGLVSFRCD